MIIYAMAWNQNLQVERQIASTRNYIQDENNLKLYNEKLAIKAKAKKIEDYNNASARYLKQLENSARFSNKWVDFFTTEMAATIGSESEINSYRYTGNILSLKCTTYDEKNPKLFAQHLSEMKKKDGTIMFSDVEYTGFDYQKGNFGEMTYNFDLKITLWQVETATTKESQPEAAETSNQSESEQ